MTTPQQKSRRQLERELTATHAVMARLHMTIVDYFAIPTLTDSDRNAIQLLLWIANPNIDPDFGSPD